jgi:Flp pilus assembly protein TadG
MKASKPERGAVLVEAAILVGSIMMMIAVAADLGAAFVSANHLTDAVREAARIASMTPGLTTDDARITTAFNARFPEGPVSVTVDGPRAWPIITNQRGETCNLAVMVSAPYYHEFRFGMRLVGQNGIDMRSQASVRWAYQPLCD